MKISIKRWQKAQDEEITHHDGGNSSEHMTYGPFIFSKYINFNYEEDFKDKTIVEVGGARWPALFCCKSNFKKAYGIEPLLDRWSKEIKQGYLDNNIIPIKTPYELIDLGEVDETWFFNVLQHAICPEEMLLKAKKTSKVIRVFEPINTPTNVPHPHSLTQETFTKVLGDFGHIYNGGSEPNSFSTDCYYGVWNADNNI
tara:strand:- start:187 stop:783 length:597 start_codon:yes stop_codon:yes gene_type:complete